MPSMPTFSCFSHLHQRKSVSNYSLIRDCFRRSHLLVNWRRVIAVNVNFAEDGELDAVVCAVSGQRLPRARSTAGNLRAELHVVHALATTRKFDWPKTYVLNLFRTTRLLASKLIAREAEHHQTLVLILLIQLLEALVLLRDQRPPCQYPHGGRELTGVKPHLRSSVLALA